MQQHNDFHMAISVLKFQAWPDEKPAFLGCFSKRSAHILVVTCLRLQFRPVGYGWQWISEGLNCVRFLFICNLKNWTPVTFKWHFSVLFFLVCFRTRLVAPCLERTDLLALVCDI